MPKQKHLVELTYRSIPQLANAAVYFSAFSLPASFREFVD